MTVTRLDSPTSGWSTLISRWAVWIFSKLRKRVLSPDALPHDPTNFLPPGLSSVKPPSIANLERWTPWILTPPNVTTKRTLFYLHGGAYVSMISPHHWKMLDRIAAETQTNVVVQTYPMIPYAGVHDVIDQLVDTFSAVREQEGGEMVLGGDSAGGGLSMSLTIALHKAGAKLPHQLMLIVPWLDLTASQPNVDKHAKMDPWLSRELADRFGRYWGTGAVPLDRYHAEMAIASRRPNAEEAEKMRHPLASPIFDDIAFLKEADVRVTIIVGTHDILFPDSLSLADKCEEAGVQCTFIRGKGCIHVYPLFIAAPRFLFRDSEAGFKMVQKRRGEFRECHQGTER